MIHVVTVKYVGDLSLRISFNDDSEGTVDLTELIGRVPSFAHLRDVAMFRRAYVDDGEICWPGDLNISTARIYAIAHGLPTPESLEQARANELTMRARPTKRAAAGS